LVMEDDNLVTPYMEYVDQYMAQVPEKFDVLYLGFINKHINYDIVLPRNYSQNLFRMDSTNWIPIEGANAQIITKEVASKIVEVNSKHHCTGDGIYSEIHRMFNFTYYAILPQLLVQKL